MEIRQKWLSGKTDTVPKIHIIYPDIETGYYPNLNHGIAFLAGAVRSAGHEFSLHHVTDPELPENVADKALAQSPDVIGFSTGHNQRRWVRKYIDALRKKNCTSLLVAGGIYPTTDSDAAFEYLDIDAAAIGEAEGTLIGLLEKLETQHQSPGHGAGQAGNWKLEKGFYFRGDGGEVIKNEIPPLEPDLTKLPLPDYSVFDIDKIVDDSGGWMTMLIMRGCPYNCHYCCNSILMNLYPEKKDYFRVPPVDFAIELIKHNLTFGKNIKGILFDDDLLCLKEDWFADFAEKYKAEINLPYTMNARVETLTEKTVDAMRTSGCRIVNIGVESGNQNVREKLLNRFYTNEQLIGAFARLKKAGVRTSTFNMMALPFETREQMLDTLNINRRLKPYRGACFYFYPYPRTRLYDICVENGLLKDGYEDFTGYFAKPAIRMTECREAVAIRICQKLRLYLYCGRLLSSVRMTWALSLLYYVLLPLAGPVSHLIVSDGIIKRFIRKYIYSRQVQ